MLVGIMLVAKQPDVKAVFQVFEFKWKDSQSRCL